MKNPGIYILTNKVNGKQYVGKSSNLLVRVNQHLLGSSVQCPAIYNAISFYGVKQFSVEIVPYSGISVEALSAVEKWKIRQLGTKSPRGYNLTDGGDGPVGVERSLEVRLRKSESMLGKRNHFWGKTHSDKSKGEISESLRGEKNPNFGGFKGRNPPFLGNKHSDETKRKLSEVNPLKFKRRKAEWMWVRSLAMCWYEMYYYVMKERELFFDKDIPDTSHGVQLDLFD